ncbi:MAG: hypothetical protein AAF766_22815 [Cyanobacteria bacterium P01_D01_bin.14]
MHRLDPLINSLLYRQMVLVWPIQRIKLWGVLSIDGDHKDYFLANFVESLQPHETTIGELDRNTFMAVCYPACRAVAYGMDAKVISIVEPEDLIDVLYLSGAADAHNN